MRTLPTAALVALALLCGAAQAAAPLHGLSLSAEGVDLTGPAKAWVLPAGVDGITWTLDGAAAKLTDYSFTYPRVAGEYVIEVYPPTETSYTNVHASVGSWMERSLFLLVAVPGEPPPQVAFHADRLLATPERQPCILDPNEITTGGGHQCFDVGGGGNLTRADGVASVTVRGTFLLRLWGFEGPMASDQGPVRLWTGRSSYHPGDGPASLEQTAQEDLLVRDGQLTVTLQQPSPGSLHLAAAHAEMESSVLDGPGGPRALGPGAADLGFEGGRVQVTPLATAPAPPPVAAVALWPWALGSLLLLAALAIAALVALRVLRPGDPVLRALHRRDPIRAARLAAAAPPATSPEQAAVRAVAFLQAGELELAERQLVAYALPHADATFILACVRARQGQDEEARRLLAESVAANPAYAGEARLNADLARLGDPERPGAQPPRPGPARTPPARGEPVRPEGYS